MLERGLSITEASADSGVKRDRLSKLLKNNRPVEIKTASKLAKYFGDDAIIIADAAQERK
jgi:plasmid maintenance system antidote protein VapI